MTYSNLRKGRYSQTGNIYHITATTLDRIPCFASLWQGRIVVRELIALQEAGRANTLCYVLMPDHLHWLMQLEQGTLSEAVKMLKGRASHAIGRAVWQAGYYDHAVRQDEDLRRMARYIVANPLRAGLVERIGDYPLWDAIWLDEALDNA